MSVDVRVLSGREKRSGTKGVESNDKNTNRWEIGRPPGIEKQGHQKKEKKTSKGLELGRPETTRSLCRQRARSRYPGRDTYRD